MKIEKRLGKTDPKNRGEILLRVTASRECRYRIKSGIKVYADNWDKDLQAIVLPRLRTATWVEMSKAKKDLAAIDAAITDAIEASEGAPTKAQVEAAVQAISNPTATNKSAFFMYWDDFMGAKNIKPATKRTYAIVRKILLRFEIFRRIKGRGNTLPLHWTKDIVRDWHHYSRSEHIYYKLMPEIFNEVPLGRGGRTGKAGRGEQYERGINTVTRNNTLLRSYF